MGTALNALVLMATALMLLPVPQQASADTTLTIGGSASNVPEDGKILTSTASGAGCPTASYTKFTNDGSTTVSPRRSASANAAGVCGRAYFEFNTTAIPESAIISQVQFKYKVTANVGTPENCDIMPVTTAKPSSVLAAALWTDLGDGTAYLANDSSCTSTGVKTVTLPAAANTDLQNQLSSNWFAVGMKYNNETRTTSAISTEIYTTEDVGGNTKPTILVTFTATVTIPIQLTGGSGTTAPLAANFTVSGTGCTGTLGHNGNPASQNYVCSYNATITVTAPADSATSRYRFSDDNTVKTFTSCMGVGNTTCSTTSYTVYRQFNQTMTLAGLNAQTVDVTRTILGSGGTQAVGTTTTAIWVDQASTLSLQDPKVVTTNQERYDTSSTTSFTNIQAAATRAATYYHQYAILTTLSGLDAAQTNPVTRTQLGVSSTDSVPGATATVVWNDAAATYTAPATVTISGTERFNSYNTTAQRSFAVSAYAAKTFIYNHEYQLASLTFKTDGGSSLTTAPTAFTFTMSNGTTLTAISSTWVKNGTATVTGITWRGLAVTPTANTIPVTSGGAKTLNTNIAENSSPLIQFAIDTGTVGGVSWDANTRQLSYTGTATGTRDTILEYPTSTLSNMQQVMVDGISHSDNVDDTINGLLTVNDVAYSAHTFTITFGLASGGGGGGGGGGVLPQPTTPPYLPPIGTFSAAVIVPHIQAKAGATTQHIITIQVEGSQGAILKEIVFSNHPEWFHVGLMLPYAAVADNIASPEIIINVPINITLPASENDGLLPSAFGDEEVVMVTTVSDGIRDRTISTMLNISTGFSMDSITNEMWLIGAVVVVIGAAIGVARIRKRH